MEDSYKIFHTYHKSH